MEDNRLIVEVRDNNGNLIEQIIGKSTEELLQDHNNKVCAYTCPFCHQELADLIGEDDAIEAMYKNTFNKPMPR